MVRVSDERPCLIQEIALRAPIHEQSRATRSIARDTYFSKRKMFDTEAMIAYFALQLSVQVSPHLNR